MWHCIRGLQAHVLNCVEASRTTILRHPKQRTARTGLHATKARRAHGRIHPPCQSLHYARRDQLRWRRAAGRGGCERGPGGRVGVRYLDVVVGASAWGDGTSTAMAVPYIVAGALPLPSRGFRRCATVVLLLIAMHARRAHHCAIAASMPVSHDRAANRAPRGWLGVIVAGDCRRVRRPRQLKV